MKTLTKPIKTTLLRATALVLAVTCCLGGTLNVYGQISDWDAFTDGNKVYDIIEKNNELYLATTGGMVVYNKSAQSKTFYNTGNSNIPGNYVSALASDNSGDIWTGCRGVMATFDGNSWIPRVQFNTHYPINQAIEAEGNGDVWMGFSTGGVVQMAQTLNQYTPNNSPLPVWDVRGIAIDNNNVKWFATNGDFTDGGLVGYDGTNWTNYNINNNNFPSNRLSSVVADNQGLLWITSFNEGLISYGNGSWSVYNTSNSGISDNSLNSVFIDHNDNKWIATANSGIVKFDGTNWTVYNTQNSGLVSDEIHSIYVDNAGVLWAGTGNSGLTRFDGNSWQLINTSETDFPVVTIYDSEVDNQGNLWLASYQGLVKYDGINWHLYNTENSDIPSNLLLSVTIDNNGVVWAGTHYYGLVRFDGTNWTVFDKFNSGLASDTIYTVKIDDNNNIWAGHGISDKGLSHFNGTTWNKYNTSNSSLAHNDIRSLDIDQYNNVWIGMYLTPEVQKYDGSSWTTYNFTAFNVTGIWKVKVNKNAPLKEVWVGTDNGLGLISDGSTGITWQTYHTGNSDLPGNVVSAIDFDNQQNVWVGSLGIGAGFSKFDRTSWTTHTGQLNTALPYFNPIRSIAIDPQENKWIFTEINGALKFSGDKNCLPINAFAGNDTTVFAGDTVTLQASGGQYYEWSTGDTTATITIIADTTQTIELTVYDSEKVCNNTANVTITVLYRPTLTFTPEFYNKGVFPDTGYSNTAFEYKVIYSHPGNVPPTTGTPMVGIDTTGNGQFDLVVSMSESDANDHDYTNGKEYFFVRGYIPGTPLKYSFFALDENDVPAIGDPVDMFNGPLVLNETMDLYLFANHISFSDNNPAENTPVTITARIYNNSNVDVSDVPVSFYHDNTLLANKTVNKIYAGSYTNVSISETFPMAGYYPIKVVIDENNTIAEDNKLNNFAIRPLTVGNFTMTGEIIIEPSFGPKACPLETIVYRGTATYSSEFGNNVPAAGAEVTLRNDETGQFYKTYTNSEGRFAIPLIAPMTQGFYWFTVEATDFTVSGTGPTTYINVVGCPIFTETHGVSTKAPHWVNINSSTTSGESSGGTLHLHKVYSADLLIRSEHISPTNINPDENEHIQVVATFFNEGNLTANNFYVRFSIDDQQLGDPIFIEELHHGMMHSVMATDSFASPVPGYHVIEVDIDHFQNVPELNKGNNIATRGIIVGDTFFDLKFLDDEGLTLSNNAPLLNEDVSINAQIEIIGSTNVSGEIHFYTVVSGDTTLFDTAPFTIDEKDTASVSVNWNATTETGKILAHIANLSPDLDVYPENNFAFVDLGIDGGEQNLPVFTNQPGNLTLCEGDSVMLSIEANNVSVIQWYQNNQLIEDANQATLRTASSGLSGSVEYFSVISNSFAKDTSRKVIVQVDPLPASDFSFTIDENHVSFTNTSDHAISYRWSFGNGDSSVVENPEYSFENTGNYDVCLTAFNDCGSSISCQSVLITTDAPDTISGTVTFDGVPLDAGHVELWVMSDGRYKIASAKDLTAADKGVFSFGSVEDGDYLVKAYPSTSMFGNESFFKSSPLYQADKVFWNNAGVIVASFQGINHTVDIDMKTTPDFAVGSSEKGVISGNTSIIGAGKKEGKENVQVLLMDDRKAPWGYLLSDEEGNYEFESLPFDTFRLQVEITGMMSEDVQIILSEDAPEMHGVNFVIDDSNNVVVIVTGIDNLVNGNSLSEVNLYPNPVHSELIVSYSSQLSGTAKIMISSLSGRSLIEVPGKVTPGDNTAIVDMKTLPQGIYLVSVILQEGNNIERFNARVVKIE